jgi:hypothetical protein
VGRYYRCSFYLFLFNCLFFPPPNFQGVWFDSCLTLADLKAMEDAVRSIQMDGLTWGAGTISFFF